MGYLILTLGILTGIAANSFAKISDGFPKLNCKVPKVASQKKSLKKISTWFK